MVIELSDDPTAIRRPLSPSSTLYESEDRAVGAASSEGLSGTHDPLTSYRERQTSWKRKKRMWCIRFLVMLTVDLLAATE